MCGGGAMSRRHVKASPLNNNNIPPLLTPWLLALVCSTCREHSTSCTILHAIHPRPKDAALYQPRSLRGCRKVVSDPRGPAKTGRFPRSLRSGLGLLR